MSRAQLLAFMRRYRVAVQTSVSAFGAPQAAIVGVAIGDDFEVVFDTLQTSRKAQNLRQSPKVALVVGGWSEGEEQTVQYEGIADEPVGSELDRIRELYFAVYPDGRDRLASWPGLIHVRVRPTWLRYSDFGQRPEVILEFSASELAALR
jgi:pyridoxine/pyridoxamine 5'-phosphate oxidase